MSTTAAPCAALSRELAESPAATASTARTWLLLEQPGPWGAKALTSSHLDPALGRALENAAKGTGVRVALVRRPERHADTHHGTDPRRVVLAHTVPGAGWIRTTEIRDPRALLGLDFTRLGAGHHDGFGADHTGEPLALVCTNGRRDRCCALLGRPLAAELHASGHGEVWEVTHLGGHRFAPTMLVLPHGYAYARQTAASAKAVLAAVAAGRTTTRDCRGRSCWDPAGQAAELAVRDLTGEDRADTLSVLPVTDSERDAGADARSADRADHASDDRAGSVSDDRAGSGRDDRAVCGTAVRVAHRDGRSWTVTVTSLPAGSPARPQSCGGAAVEPVGVRVLTVSED